MENDTVDKPPALSEIKDAFDRVLGKHINRLIEVGSDATLSFNLATISCLLLVVERDREIKNFPESPPERYVRESLLEDLADMGLEIDDDLMIAFQSLTTYGYVEIGSDNMYHPQLAAIALVNFIDNLFPQMPGMNLVAYVIQLIEEIQTGRKELDVAIDYFEQTLLSRGVALSQQKIQEEEKEQLKQSAVLKVQDPADTARREAELKKAAVEKLARLRSMGSKSARPSILGRRKGAMGELKSRELFAKGPTPEEIAAEKRAAELLEEEKKAREEAERLALEEERKKAELAEKEIAARAREIAEAEIAAAEEKRREAEAAAREALENAEREAREARERAEKAAQEAREEAERIAREEELRKAELAAREEELRKAELAAREEELRKAELEAREKELAAREAELSAAAGPPEAADGGQGEPAASPAGGPSDIESQIAAFEAAMAAPCPICGVGKVLTGTTETGKEYFSCNSDTCNFISWTRPHNFPCPVCRNPFLAEQVFSDGSSGLKCPRATCSYSQHGVADPALAAAPAPASAPPPPPGVPGAAPPEPPKKKRRVVRRKKK